MASTGVARAQTSPVAVLGVEATDAAPNSVATSITTAMRQKVSSTADFKLVPGRDLVEVKLIFSCPDEAPSCMAEAANSLGAEKLIFGSVKKAPGGNYLVTLKLLDVKTAKVEAYIAEQLDRRQATGPAVRGPGVKWFADLTGRGATGTIRVSANVIGASILLDGLPVSVTREDPVDLENIAAGSHEVVLSKPDHEPVKRVVTVQAGKVVEVDGDMDAASGMGGADVSLEDEDTMRPSSSEGSSGLKFAAWSTAGAGVVSLVLALKFGADVTAINTDLDPFRRCEGEAAQRGYRSFDGEPVMPDDLALRASEKEEVQQLRDDGDQAELLQYVFYGTSAVLLGASAYLFYAAYLDDGDDNQASKGKGTSTALVTPYVTPAGAGVTARWAF